MKKIVFDIETSNLFSDVASNDPADLNLAVICIYETDTEKYSHFLQPDLHKLWPIIESADMLIGYNSDHFDIPLLNKYYPGDLTKVKSLDILKEIKEVFGRRMKLDQVAEGTLGTHKTSDGLQGVRWWRAGEYQKVIDYCLADVRITKDVYEYATTHDMLFFAENGEKIKIPLKTADWETVEKVAMTHTLPF